MSWGTKGSDKAEALPSVSSKKTKDADAAVVEDVARNKEDLDAHFKETVTRAVTKLQVTEEVEKPTMDDENKTFRTRLVAFWMLTNATLAVSIDNLNGLSTGSAEEDDAVLRKKQNIYFAVILYSTFGLAAVRFTGVSTRSQLFQCRVLTIITSACSTSSSGIFSGAAGETELEFCRCIGVIRTLLSRHCCIWDRWTFYMPSLRIGVPHHHSKLPLSAYC